MELHLLDKKNFEFVFLDGKKIFISSYGLWDLNQEVFFAQKKVFDKFGITINQFFGRIGHPTFLDFVINNIESDFYIFFDIDCIPLVSDLVEYLINKIGYDSIIGIQQYQDLNHTYRFDFVPRVTSFEKKHIYCGPACFAISKIHYLTLGKPSFTETSRADVAEEFTFISREKGYKYHFLMKTSSDNKLWKLGEDDYFGHGTIYENKVYHQFEIRAPQNVKKFLKKCNEVLG